MGENVITNATKKSTFRVDVTHEGLRRAFLSCAAAYLWQTVAGGHARQQTPIMGAVPWAAVCQGNNTVAGGRAVRARVDGAPQYVLSIFLFCGWLWLSLLKVCALYKRY